MFGKEQLTRIKRWICEIVKVIIIFLVVSIANLNIANSLIKGASLVEKMMFVLFGEVAVCTYFIIKEIKKAMK